MTHRRAKGERSRRRLRSRLCVDHDLAKHRADRDLAFAPIAAPRRTQLPLSLPSSLNLTEFNDFFFWVLFVFLYWRMNDIIYLFGNRENVRKCDWIWWFFFLGFVYVFVLRNEWYYIFVWQPRKCEQQVENGFSMVFSRTQPNTRKYFLKHFLKCNQTHENIFLSGNTFTRTKRSLRWRDI